MLRAVLLDVDFTLCRPGPEIGPDGYRAVGAAHGLELPVDRYDAARLAAIQDLEMHPELDHDEEVWVRFTEDIVRGMGGSGPRVAEVAREIVSRWEHARHFELYDDVLPTLAVLRAAGLRLALISNTSRDLAVFVEHHGIEVDAWIASGTHGKMKPSPSIFRAALDLVGAAAVDTVMVGDSPADDIGGARALGMRGILIDRAGRFPNEQERIETLAELPACIGVAR